jgi:hypothetical protein
MSERSDIDQAGTFPHLAPRVPLADSTFRRLRSWVPDGLLCLDNARASP